MATITTYNDYLYHQFGGVGATQMVDWSGDTIKVALVTATYVPDVVNHAFFSDITNEVSGTNYTAGGNTLANGSVSESAGTTTVDADDTTWLQDAAGFTNARYAIIFKDTGVSTTSTLFGYVDFVTDKGNVNGDLTISWNASGIFTVS